MTFPDSTSDEMAECHCICQGWAEIVIRRPSGNISWMMRIQNRPVGPLLGMPEVDGDVTTAVIDDSHIKECEFVRFLLSDSAPSLNSQERMTDTVEKILLE